MALAVLVIYLATFGLAGILVGIGLVLYCERRDD